MSVIGMMDINVVCIIEPVNQFFSTVLKSANLRHIDPGSLLIFFAGLHICSLKMRENTTTLKHNVLV